MNKLITTLTIITFSLVMALSFPLTATANEDEIPYLEIVHSSLAICSTAAGIKNERVIYDKLFDYGTIVRNHLKTLLVKRGDYDRLSADVVLTDIWFTTGRSIVEGWVSMDDSLKEQLNTNCDYFYETLVGEKQ